MMNPKFAAKNDSSRTYVCTETRNPKGKTSQLVCKPATDKEAITVNSFVAVDGSKCNDCDRPGPTVYVQAGAATGGNGQKWSPYNTLAQAQADATWKTLVVLYSTSPLDGGITVRPGTTVVGDTSNSPAKPLLSNTLSSSNGGNGIVVSSGDVCIQNLEFDNVWASAIEFSNGRNVSIIDCDIHGYNQGEVTVALKGQDQEVNAIPVAGVHGQCQNSGTTTLCNVAIHDNHTGDGFLEVVYGTANRQVRISRSDIRNLINTLPNIPLTNTAVKGITVLVTSPDAVHNVFIDDTNIQDFAPDGVSDRGENLSKHAIFAESDNGGKTNIHVNKCTFSNIFQDTPVVGTSWIYAGTHPIVGTTPSNIVNSKKSSMILTVVNCDFTVPEANGGDIMMAVLTSNCNGNLTSNFNNNSVTNLFFGFVSFSKGIARDSLTVSGNNAVCLGALVVASSEQDHIVGYSGAMNTTYTINNNNLLGGNVFGAIGIVPHWSANGIAVGASRWASMTITATGNCFDGSGGNYGINAGIFGLDLFGFGAATATYGKIQLSATYNDIVNYAFDVFDALGGSGINVQYSVKNNYWGTTPLTPLINAIVLSPSTLDAVVPSDSLSAAVVCPVNVISPPNGARQVYKSNRSAVNVDDLLNGMAPVIVKLQRVRF